MTSLGDLRAPRRTRSRLGEYAQAIAIMMVVTAVCFALRSRLTTVDVAMLLLLGVVVVAGRYARGPSVLASVLSIAAFDFLFVPPYYSFEVHDPSYVTTFVVMLVVAITMGQLTSTIREHAKETEVRRRQASALAALNAQLAAVSGPHEVLDLLARHVSQVATGRVCTLTAEQLDGEPAQWGAAARELLGAAPEAILARSVQESGQAAGPGTERFTDSEILVVPLRSAGRGLGLVAVRPEPVGRIPEPEEVATVNALAAEAAPALERTLLAEQHRQARTEAEAERLRTSLLSSLSHDFRTPLATIEGAASSLLEEDGVLTPETRHDLADTILGESHRMTRLVSNLLNMIRVETGALAVQKSWQPLEEALGVALLRLEERLKDHPVAINLPPDLPLVPIDELLVEQVFINLLENAAKYTPLGTAIAVTATHAGPEVCVEVADRGPGVPPGSEEMIFKKFYRNSGSPGRPSVGGAGLGLTISRGIITAHGGRMWVEPHPGGGAAFRFTVPLSGPEVTAVPVELDSVASDG